MFKYRGITLFINFHQYRAISINYINTYAIKYYIAIKTVRKFSRY